MLEFGLAFLQNLSCFFGIVGVSSVCYMIGRGVCFLVDNDYGDYETAKKHLSAVKKIIPICLVCGFFACMPNINEMWKVRIAVIKFQLASPENIKAGVDEITRIGKRLECKYLGCDEPKKEEKKN